MDARGMLGAAYAEIHPEDTARVLERVPPDLAAGFLADIDPAVAAGTVRLLSPGGGASCLAAMDGTHAAAILSALGGAEAAGIVRRMGAPEQRRTLDALPKKTATSLQRLMQYRDGSAGSMADPGVLGLREDMTVTRAQERVRRISQPYIYLIDRGDKLCGVVKTTDVLAAPGDGALGTLARSDVTSLLVGLDLASVLNHSAWRSLDMLPVVERDGTYVGAIAHKTLRLLESSPKSPRSTGVAVLVSLGELYWLTLGELLAWSGATWGRPPTDAGGSDGGER
jgi:Mg/Co/Ni transporter MgtE